MLPSASRLNSVVYSFATTSGGSPAPVEMRFYDLGTTVWVDLVAGLKGVCGE